jgi:hypothetical protein
MQQPRVPDTSNVTTAAIAADGKALSFGNWSFDPGKVLAAIFEATQLWGLVHGHRKARLALSERHKQRHSRKQQNTA